MPNPSGILIDVREITLAYGSQPVVTDLSLSILPGSLIGLIGPNGAGKTTLLLSMSGQFRPQKGHIEAFGGDIYEENLAFKQRIGIVHEHPFFYSYLSVAEFLYFVARIKKVTAIEDGISWALRAVCLEAESQKKCAELSMGMRKKLAIASALLGDPEILFLDEALNGIDVESAFQIKKVLLDFVAKGKTIVLSTHVLEVIEKLCDRYIVIKNGEIIADLQSKEFQQSAGTDPHSDLESYVIQLLKT